MAKVATFAALFLFLAVSPAGAETITFQNGDRLTAKIVRETPTTVYVKHEVLGELAIRRTDIASISTTAPQAPGAPAKKERQKGDLHWDRKLSAGYEFARGNTDTTNVNGDFLINRNRLWIDEWTFKGSGTQGFVKHKRSAQVGEISLRYGYSLTKQLYNFYRFGAEHDYFENIRVRLLPSTGLGYWFLDTDKTKLLAETGVGYQQEFFRTGGSQGKWVGHARNLISRKITEHLEVGHDLYYFPALADFGDYRFEEELFLRFIFSERFALKIKTQDQYRSRPLNGAKRNDLRFISGIEYSF